MSDFVEFSTQNWLLFLALFAIAGMLIGGEVLRKMRGVSSLSAAEGLRLINDQEALILDVRDGGEYKEGHIPQARHIPLGALRDRLGELTKAKDKPSSSIVATVPPRRRLAHRSKERYCRRLQSERWVVGLAGGQLAGQSQSPDACARSGDAEHRDVHLRYCPYCRRARALLDNKGVVYTLLDVNRDPRLWEKSPNALVATPCRKYSSATGMSVAAMICSSWSGAVS